MKILLALGKYGVKKIYHVDNAALNHFDAQVFTNAIAEVVQRSGAKSDCTFKQCRWQICKHRVFLVKLKAGLVFGAVASLIQAMAL